MRTMRTIMLLPHLLGQCAEKWFTTIIVIAAVASAAAWCGVTDDGERINVIKIIKI